MVVIVGEARNDRPAVEIDRACRGTGQREDFAAGAEGDKPVALHCEGLMNAKCGVHGDDLAVMKDRVGSRERPLLRVKQADRGERTGGDSKARGCVESHGSKLFRVARTVKNSTSCSTKNARIMSYFKGFGGQDAALGVASP
jgi:hypothetical protein